MSNLTPEDRKRLREHKIDVLRQQIFVKGVAQTMADGRNPSDFFPAIAHQADALAKRYVDLYHGDSNERTK